MRLGLRKREFFELTPRLLMALCGERERETRERGLLVALLRRDIINFSFCRPKEPVQIEDLIPAERGAPRRKGTRMTRRRREAVAERLRSVFGSQPGGLIVKRADGTIVEGGD